MTRHIDVPLDSYRLAQYAVQVPCYVCEEGNTFDAEFCRHCFAPMALSHQAHSQRVQPMMVAAIGASGAGKTVYMGTLIDMLSRRGGPVQVLARGAFSITLQQATIMALSRCEFPKKTPNEPDSWNWVHCQIRSPKQRRPAELIMPDMAGEAILEEIHHPYTYRVIRSLLEKCSGVMVLVDAAQVGRGRDEQDYFTMKLLSYLSELDDDPNTGWRQRPVAVIFSKADLCDVEIEDAPGYARAHVPGLWQHCQERFTRHRFFAAGVADACALRQEFGAGPVRIPLRIEPRGIIEPFEWLLGEISS